MCQGFFFVHTPQVLLETADKPYKEETSMNWNPEEDGVTHVNVSDKGRTKLGLSLAVQVPSTDGRLIETPHGNFPTVSDYADYLLRKNEYKKPNYEDSEEFKGLIYPTLLQKVKHLDSLLKREFFFHNWRPLAFYDVLYGKRVVPFSCQWIIHIYEEIRFR
jgi:hypothetical protein